jgi:hypothetical protein
MSAPKCFCDEMENGQLCDHCERDKYLAQQEEAMDRVMNGDF